jgi:hypothetical protein
MKKPEMAKKPLLTHRIKDQRMEFSHHYGWMTGKKSCSVMSHLEIWKPEHLRQKAAGLGTGSRRSSPRNCQASS